MSIELVRDAFSKASGLNVRHAALSYVGNAQMLEFEGIDGYGKEFKFQLGPFYGDPQGYAQTQGAIYKNRILHKIERIMATPRSIAQRIAESKKKLELESDALAKRLDDLDAKAPAAFAHAHSVVEGQHSDIDGMEAELRQLTNLPK